MCPKRVAKLRTERLVGSDAVFNQPKFGVNLRQRHIFCNHEDNVVFNVVFKNMKNELFGSDNVG